MGRPIHQLATGTRPARTGLPRRGANHQPTAITVRATRAGGDALVAAQLRGRRTRARLVHAGPPSRAVAVRTACAIRDALRPTGLVTVRAHADVARAALPRPAAPTLHRPTATVRCGPALGSDGIACLLRTTAVVRRASPAARLGRRARPAIQHPGAPVGHFAAADAEVTTGLGRARGGAAHVGLLASTVLASRAAAAIHHATTAVGRRAALRAKLHARLRATPALVRVPPAPADRRRRALAAREHVVTAVGHRAALRPQRQARLRRTGLRAALVRAIPTAKLALRTHAAGQHATALVRRVPAFRGQSQTCRRGARPRVRARVRRRLWRQGRRLPLLTRARHHEQHRKQRRVPRRHGAHYAGGCRAAQSIVSPRGNADLDAHPTAVDE